MNNCAIFNYNHSSEIIKTDLYESWICRIEKGKAKVVFEQTEYKVATDTIFFVQEGASFKVLSSSRDMQMEVLVFKEALMNVVYSLCGAEADFGELETVFWTDKNIDEQYGRIMAMDYELLKVAVQNTNLIARNKMIMTGLVHLLLTIYNASDISSETKQSDNGKRSRMLLNHFFELVSEKCNDGTEKHSLLCRATLCISSLSFQSLQKGNRQNAEGLYQRNNNRRNQERTANHRNVAPADCRPLWVPRPVGIRTVFQTAGRNFTIRVQKKVQVKKFRQTPDFPNTKSSEPR